MKIKTLNQKHECYDADTFAKYQALYEGGQTFHSQINRFLTKSLTESEQTYSRRAGEACYISYVNSIVNQFASQVFSCPFVIRTDPKDADPFYAEFKENCDGQGRDLANLMRDCFTSALVKGATWLLAEMPDDGEPAPDNLLDYQARGLGQAVVSELKPEAVYDWECDAKGEFTWIITYDKKVTRTDPRLERKLVTETWKIYDPLTVETFSVTYEVGKKPSADTDVPGTDKKLHGFTRVPLVPMRLPKGLWLVNKLADAQTEHFRMDNALGWAMRRTCYPTAVFKTDDKEDSSGIIASSDGFAIKIGVEEEFDWKSAPADSFQSIQSRVTTIKDELHRIALQMSLAVDNTPGTLKRSGDSKAMDAQATEVCLHALASHVKATIEDLFELVSDARGDTGLIFSIEGMDQYNVMDSDAIVKNAQIAKQLGIPSETFSKELSAKVAEALLFNVSQDIKDQIREEILSAKVDLTPAEPKQATDNVATQPKEDK